MFKKGRSWSVSGRIERGSHERNEQSWWASVSRFGREVSPGPPTRRSETTTTKETFGGYTPHPTVFWCAYLFGLPANRAGKRSFSRRRAPKRSRPVSPEDSIPTHDSIENPIENPIDRESRATTEIYVHISLFLSPRRPVSSQGFSYLSSSLFLLPQRRSPVRG